MSVIIDSSLVGSFAKKFLSILLYRVSSTFFGSTKINFTSFGCFLNNIEHRIALSPTDFPWPVAPAIRRWGILVKSITKVSFEIVFPIATGSSKFDFWNFSDAITSFIETIVGFWLGTSIPTVPLPGNGAIILTPMALILRAISFSKFFIFEILTPVSGTISYRVMVGPTVARLTITSIRKSFKVSSMSFLLFSTSFWLTDILFSEYCFSISKLG